MSLIGDKSGMFSRPFAGEANAVREGRRLKQGAGVLYNSRLRKGAANLSGLQREAWCG